MRFTLAAAAVFSAVLSTASAAHLNARQISFPDCALPCVTSPANLFGCASTDNKCLCTNTQYVQETTQCIVNACDADDASSAEATSRAICEQIGITLTSTPSLTGTGAPASSTPPASASTTPSGSDSGSNSASNTSAPAPSSTAPPSSSGSASGSGSGAPAPSTTTTSGAGSTNANINVNAFVGVAALVFGAFAL